MMPRKLSDKTVTKLVNYIKEDRPRKFRECVRNYDVDVRKNILPKGRTLLHCAAKHGSGYFVSYLLEHGASAAQADSRGDLPLHLAVYRALHLPPDEAAEVYSEIVIPLLKNYPNAVNYCDRQGTDICCLLSSLNRHIRTEDDSDSDSDSSDSEWSESSSSSSSFDDWSDRLAREFENESSDFFGRYSYSDDFAREQQDESYNEWAERMGREMHGRRHYQHHGQSQASDARKRKHTPSDHTRAPPKVPRGTDGINTKEEIHKAKMAQNMVKMRKSYEERFKAALNDKSEKKMGFGDIPWPSRGSIDNVMEVLFGDKSDWSAAALKKYVREQQVRWHPDKFLQKFIDKIAPKSFEKVMERVKEISQALNKKAESLSAG